MGGITTIFTILFYLLFNVYSVLASNKFPHAETLISDAIGTDNEYSKTAYHYLYSLYSRWHKNDRAFEYKDKILKPL